MAEVIADSLVLAQAVPWYREGAILGLLGTLLGAMVGAGMTLFVWRKSRKVRQVDCALGNPTSLLSISDSVRRDFVVTYEDQPVTAAYLFPLDIANTGNEPISDQPVIVELASGSTIIDVKMETEPRLGFGEVTFTHDKNRVKGNITLLNPRDSVRLEILSVDNPKDTIEVGLKNEGVSTRVFTRHSIESGLQNLSAGPAGMFAMFSAIPFMGSVASTYALLALASKIDKLAEKERRGAP